MFRFFLFGRFEAFWDNTPLSGFEAKKVRELFCYLATYRDRPHAREQLAELLWEGYPPASSRKNMRQTLWQLQSTLNSVPGAARVLSVDNEFISLNLEADVSIDVEQFETVADALADVEGYRLTEGRAKSLRDAIELYRAHFLEGWYEDWCLRERERFQNLCLTMLDKLSAYCESRQEYETAIHYCNRALRMEYVRECSHRQLMRLHYLCGDRTAALRQFDLCTAALADALDIAPSYLTLQLYGHICQDNLPAIQQPEQHVPGSQVDDGTWRTIVDLIAELKPLLEGIQQQVSERLGRI